MKKNKATCSPIDLKVLTEDPLIAKLCYEFWMCNDDGKFLYPINHLEAGYNLSPYKLRKMVKQYSIARSRKLKCAHCNHQIILSSRSDFKNIGLLCKECKNLKAQAISIKAAEESRQWEREVVQLRQEYVEQCLRVKWEYLPEKRQEGLYYEFQNVECYGKLEVRQYLARIQLGEPIDKICSKTGISEEVWRYLKLKFNIEPGKTKKKDKDIIEEANLRLQQAYEKLLSEHTALKMAISEIALGNY